MPLSDPGRLQAHFGRVRCVFDGDDGRGAVRLVSPPTVKLRAGQGTEISCERRGDRFIGRLGGTEWSRTVTGIGPIRNDSAMSVGTKRLNDVDTFPGFIDDLGYWRG